MARIGEDWPTNDEIARKVATLDLGEMTEIVQGALIAMRVLGEAIDSILAVAEGAIDKLDEVLS